MAPEAAQKGWLQQEGGAGSFRAFARLSMLLRFQGFAGFSLLVDWKSVLGILQTDLGSGPVSESSSEK